MSFETLEKRYQMESASSHDQLVLEALDRRRTALEEVKRNYRADLHFFNKQLTYIIR